MRLRKVSVVSLIVILGLLSVALGVNPALAAPASAVGALQEEREEIQLTGTVLSFDELTGALEVEVETEDGGTAVYIVWAPEGLTDIAAGDQVEVEGYLEEDGTVTAVSVVEATEEDETETPTATPTETPAGDGEGDEDENTTGKGCFFCVNLDVPHPVGQAIAEVFDVSYEQVMEWFCEGKFGFGQILLALQTAKAMSATGEADETAEGEEPDEPLGLSDLASVYLTRRAEGEGWGQIWKDVGRIAKQDKIRDRDRDRDGSGTYDNDDEVEPTRAPEPAVTASNMQGNGGGGKPVNTGKPSNSNKPANTGKPANTSKPVDTGKPADSGKPSNSHKPANSGQSNKGGRGR